jgi:hypothetical protein
LAIVRTKLVNGGFDGRIEGCFIGMALCAMLLGF